MKTNKFNEDLNLILDKIDYFYDTILLDANVLSKKATSTKLHKDFKKAAKQGDKVIDYAISLGVSMNWLIKLLPEEINVGADSKLMDLITALIKNSSVDAKAVRQAGFEDVDDSSVKYRIAVGMLCLIYYCSNNQTKYTELSKELMKFASPSCESNEIKGDHFHYLRTLLIKMTGVYSFRYGQLIKELRKYSDNDMIALSDIYSKL